MMMMMMMARFLGAHPDHLRSGRDRWNCSSCGSTLSPYSSAVLTVTESTLRPTLPSMSSPCLVLWARKRAPQLRTVLMLLKTTITLRNDEYLDIFPDVEQSGRVELGISDQGSWNSALMMAQGNRPKAGSFVGLLVVDIAAESDQNHEVSEEIMPDYTGEDQDEREPGRGNRPGNSRPEDSGEGPSRPSGLSGQSRSPSEDGAAGAGDNAGDGDSAQSGDDYDGDSDGDSDRDGGGNNNNNDLYSRPSPGM